MVAAVEIDFGQEVADPVERIRRQHQTAEHGLLGLHRLRRHPQGVDLAVGTVRLGACGHAFIILVDAAIE